MTIGGITQGVVPHNAFASDDVADKELLQKLREVKVFSVVDLQRLCFWSYNQAARKLDQFVSSGFVKKHEKTPWLFIAPPEVALGSIRSTCPCCGGDLLGDGFSTLIRCENYAGDVDVAPDSGPFFCCGGQQS